jgi:mono/diheme cytochrome c family protein
MSTPIRRSGWGFRYWCGAALAVAAGISAAQDAPKGDPDLGREVFEAQCFDCHNANSQEKKTGPGFKGVQNGTLPSGKKATREAILEVINNGAGETMPAMKNLLSDAQKEDVTAYVLTR